MGRTLQWEFGAARGFEAGRGAQGQPSATRERGQHGEYPPLAAASHTFSFY